MEEIELKYQLNALRVLHIILYFIVLSLLLYFMCKLVEEDHLLITGSVAQSPPPPVHVLKYETPGLSKVICISDCCLDKRRVL